MSRPPAVLRPSPVPRTRAWGIRLALVTAVVSGVAVFVNGYGVRRFRALGVDPTTYTTAKNLVAALGLLALTAVATVRRSEEGWTAPRTRAAWAGLLAVGVIGGSVPFVLFFEGLARASSTDAAFIHKTLVVWVALLAVPLLRERIGPLHVVAIGLLIGGQVALVGGAPVLRAGAGETMILVATLLWAVEIVVAKRLLASLSSLTVGLARMGLGVAVLLVWAAARGALGSLAELPASAWGWALLTGLILTAYVSTWYAGLARAQAVDVTAILVVGAVLTATLATVVQGAPLRPDVLGLALITAGAALVAAAGLRAHTGRMAT